MTELYDDRVVDLVHDFAWQNRDRVRGSGSQNGAKKLLNAIAPLIAAKALRDAADDIIKQRVVLLRARADEIEGSK